MGTTGLFDGLRQDLVADALEIGAPEAGIARPSVVDVQDRGDASFRRAPQCGARGGHHDPESPMREPRAELRRNAATAPFPIERCGRSLPCRQSWQDLESLKDESDVRFCVLCQRAVFLCRTTAELDRTAALGRCAAVVQMDDVNLPHQPDRDEAAA